VPNRRGLPIKGSAIGQFQAKTGESVAISRVWQRNDVVQLSGAFSRSADIAGGLADALIVLDQRYAHKPFPIFTEPLAAEPATRPITRAWRMMLADRTGSGQAAAPRRTWSERRPHLPAGAPKRSTSKSRRRCKWRAFVEAVVRAIERCGCATEWA